MTKCSQLIRKSRRRVTRDEAGFAMLSVIMLIFVVGVLAIIVLAVVLSQVSPTLFTDKNSRTLTAAQAGLDAAASQIRNAESPDGSGRLMGDIHELPCSVQGTVDTDGGETSYAVSIQYFHEDPVGRDQAWRDGKALTCYPGTGINAGLRAVPRYAMITSEGFDPTSTSQVGRADRVVEAGYTFQLTTRKVSGGQIMDDDSTFCLVAESAMDGSLITYRDATADVCLEQNELNSWTWADDYMIHLSATDVDGRIPLCLSGRPTPSGQLAYMRLRVCTTSSQDPLGQRFAWTGDHTWQGQNAANTGPEASYIVNEDSVVDAGDRLSVATGPAWKSLTPMPAVGKGNASYLTNQVVNYQQFGRCLDVTNANITYGYMIAYPCKQDPTGLGNFLWNHKWYYAEPADGEESVQTQIRVTAPANNGAPAGTYCLYTRTANSTVSGATGKFPRFHTGSSTNPIDCSSSATQWTRYGYSNDNLKAYTIQDSSSPPQCLSAAGPKSTAHAQWSTIVVVECNGKDDQKWNVDPDPVGGSLGDFVELAGSRTG